MRIEIIEPSSQNNGRSGIPAFVKGGTVDLALKEFEELEVGDVLSFDPPELAEVIVNDFLRFLMLKLAPQGRK